METQDKSILRKALLGSVGSVALAMSLLAQPAMAVVTNDNFTPEDLLDDEDVNGVGMFYRADGYVCTGTLINPRTVLFAAHCVNDYTEATWNGGIPSAWSFRADALPGFQDWVTSGFLSNPDLFVYNVNSILYHPGSIERPEGQGFLEGDIALSSLDTPASNIPTWALLFSPLPTPESIDAETGTGYHVNITGYGRTGNGTFGAYQGIDWRRRAAENMLGALTSFDERNSFLFGPGSTLTSSLYRLDFDDPNGTNIYDFNLYKDEALDREGLTAGGDSGGPLILDAENNAGITEDLVIGVLSGGSRFYGGQDFSTYGTESFYQPLFLYWDWIAENNPYRYVGANAGDGDWEDGSHWTSLQDPSYRIIDADGNVVTGTPEEPGGGIYSDGPDFGSICFDPQPRGEGVSQGCMDLSNGEFEGFDGNSDATNGSSKGQVSKEALAAVGLAPIEVNGVAVGSDQADSKGFAGLSLTDLPAQPQAETDGGGSALPSATIENGLPGATDFVPDNVDPDIAAGIKAKYFDVILSQAGRTTLSSSVEIDRLTVLGGAELNIAESGSLTTLIDVMQTSGFVNVDGELMSAGDYLLFSGLIGGSGTITTPYLTNVAGGIAPGGLGNTGELTIDGSLVMSSGSTLIIDILNGAVDNLNVTGDVSLGGVVAVNGGLAYGDAVIFLTYGGASSGEFSGATGLGNGVLYADFTNTGSAVMLEVNAASFFTVLPTDATTSQMHYGSAFDSARDMHYGDLEEVYSVIDYLSGSSLTDAFDGFAPNDGVLAGQGALMMGDALGQRLSSRMHEIRRGVRGFSVNGSTAQLDTMMRPQGQIKLASNGSLAGLASAGDAKKSLDMKAGFGGFADIDVYSADTKTGLSSVDGDLDGFTVTAGIDRALGNGAVLGAMVSYSSSDNSLDSGLGEADMDGLSFGVYGYYPITSGMFVDGFVSYGSLSVDTKRVSPLGGSVLTTTGETDADQLLVGLTLGHEFNLDNGVNITPSANVTHAKYDFDAYTEKGSVIALAVDSRELRSTQVSLGAVVDWSMGKSGNIRPMVGAAAVYDMDAGSDTLAGPLAIAPTSTSTFFSGPDRSKTWFDIEAGVDFDFSDSVVGSLGIKQSLKRDDLTQTIFGGSIQIKF